MNLPWLAPTPKEASPKAPVAGYRAWRVRDGQLWPVFFTERAWPSRGYMSAQCLEKATPSAAGEGGAHVALCHCGLHAYYDLKGLAKGMTGGDEFPGTLIVGAVAGFGPMALCEDGFRSAYAAPLALALPSTVSRYVKRDGGHWDKYMESAYGIADGDAKAVSARYEIPLVPMGKLREAAGRGLEEVRPSERPRPSWNPRAFIQDLKWVAGWDFAGPP